MTEKRLVCAHHASCTPKISSRAFGNVEIFYIFFSLSRNNMVNVRKKTNYLA